MIKPQKYSHQSINLFCIPSYIDKEIANFVCREEEIKRYSLRCAAHTRQKQNKTKPKKKKRNYPDQEFEK